MGFDKHIVSCTHHCTIIPIDFTAKKILCVVPLHPSFPPSPWGDQFFFFLAISVVLLFPKYYTVGTIQHVTVAGSSTILDSCQVILICPSLENHWTLA